MTQDIIRPADNVIRLAPTGPKAAALVDKLADEMLKLPQLQFVTEHLLHAGMYTRTVRLPPETVITACLIKVPTVLIIAGEATVYSDEDIICVRGYTVLPGSKGRKIALITDTAVGMSMIFPTDVKTVAEAEKAFTDEYLRLVPLDAVGRHRILITGE
jgi:hypothetical protein